jgi:2-keto-3-deoxy-L-fuconate dehydrogenase
MTIPEETPGEFAGLVAVVTGGASGIGAATVAELRVRGARVASLDLTDDADADLAVRCDVANDDSVRSAIGRVVDEWGRLDIVINNAGVGSRGTVEDTPEQDWCTVFQVNVMGLARVTRAALPHLRSSPSAAVVNTGSIAAWTGLQQRAAYSASKGAVHALTLAMAADHIVDGIRVNAVAPGTANTPWVQRLLASAADPELERASLNRRQPLGRLVEPDEIANAICYLASPRSGSTTGTVLGIDGGSHGLLITR